MDREAWCAAVHVVTKSWTRLSNFTELGSNPDSVLEYLCALLPCPLRSAWASYGAPRQPTCHRLNRAKDAEVLLPSTLGCDLIKIGSLHVQLLVMMRSSRYRVGSPS